MAKKRTHRIEELKEDVLPKVRKIINQILQQKTKYWGKGALEKIVKSQTLEDVLYTNLEALQETTLRIQALIIDPDAINPKLKHLKLRDKFFREYVENMKAHISRIFIALEDLGFDVKSPPSRDR